MGPYQWTPKEVARAIRYSGLGVRSVGPVGDFLEIWLGPMIFFRNFNLTMKTWICPLAFFWMDFFADLEFPWD